ncbi:MAG: DNA-processing protein DprA [Bacteroidota bacterium]|jgi:DNA processing protein
MNQDLLYKIAITQIPGVGDVLIKNLVNHCGSPYAVFQEKKSLLLKIPGIGPLTSNAIKSSVELKRAELEIKFIENNKIKPFFFTDVDYPNKLKLCPDSPAMLYYKGNSKLESNKVVGIVGCRKPTEYGKTITKNLVHSLKDKGMMVVSGLAYGIDITSHLTCIENNIQNIGVLAHGLDRIYPGEHYPIAKKMETCGGVLSEFISGTNPDKENFPRRNRIVAGLCDALVVVESKIDGGSMITADIAHSYNRDVLAFPGKNTDENSKGCNYLIKRNKAAMIESAEDLFYHMNWEPEKKTTNKKVQTSLPIDLNENESKVYEVLKEKTKVHIDEICQFLSMPMSKISGLLLNLEVQAFIISLPGKFYSIS